MLGSIRIKDVGWALGSPDAAFGNHPDFFGGSPAERDVSGGRTQIEGLIIISAGHTKFRSRSDRPGFQEFEQLLITFVDAADHVVLAELSFRQQNQSTVAATGRAL